MQSCYQDHKSRLGFGCWHQIVKVRGESMAAAAGMGKPHGMLSVIGLSDADLEGICISVREKLGPDTVCQLANYLFPQVCRASNRLAQPNGRNECQCQSITATKGGSTSVFAGSCDLWAQGCFG